MNTSSLRRTTRRRFRVAKKAARKMGDGQVCLTYDADGVPVYFAVSGAASNDEVRERAMLLRGTPVNETTRLLSRLLDNPGDIAVTLPEVAHG